MRRFLGFFALTAIGCDNGDAQDGIDGVGGTSCPVFVRSSFPDDEGEDVYYRTSVQFRLNSTDETAVIELTLADSGEVVAGTSVVTDHVVSWSAAAPLEPETTYVATLTFSCGEVSNTWTTSDAGGPLEDPSDIVGNVYSIDLAEGHWVQPYGVGVLLAPYLVGVEVLVSPTEVSDTIAMIGALGDGNGEQDLCKPSIPFPPADFENPYFELQADRLELPLPTSSPAIDDLHLSGTFTPDGDAIAGVLVSGSLDSRALVPLINGSSDEAFCVLLDAALGVQCEECADGTGPFCVTIVVDSVTADRVSGLGLVERTQEQIDADPNCPAA